MHVFMPGVFLYIERVPGVYYLAMACLIDGVKKFMGKGKFLLYIFNYVRSCILVTSWNFNLYFFASHKGH